MGCEVLSIPCFLSGTTVNRWCSYPRLQNNPQSIYAMMARSVQFIDPVMVADSVTGLKAVAECNATYPVTR